MLYIPQPSNNTPHRYGDSYYTTLVQGPDGQLQPRSMEESKGRGPVAALVVADCDPVVARRSDKGLLNVNLRDLKADLRRVAGGEG